MLSGRRRWITSALLLGGSVALAFQFRKPPETPSSDEFVASPEPAIVRRSAAENLESSTAGLPRFEGRIEPATTWPAQKRFKPLATSEDSPLRALPAEPPRMASQFQDSLLNQPKSRNPTPDLHYHQVRDGDTLAGLAERYWNDPYRAREIYLANREVLAHAEQLPIGAILKIPLRAGSSAENTASDEEAPLVPMREATTTISSVTNASAIPADAFPGVSEPPLVQLAPRPES